MLNYAIACINCYAKFELQVITQFLFTCLSYSLTPDGHAVSAFCNYADSKTGDC